MKPKPRGISTKLPPDLHRQFKALAARRDRTMQQMLVAYVRRLVAMDTRVVEERADARNEAL